MEFPAPKLPDWVFFVALAFSFIGFVGSLTWVIHAIVSHVHIYLK